MNREYHRWWSPSLHRDMDLLIFGHAGARVLAFPVSQGNFFDWENNGLIAALRDPLERGWIQLYCVDSVDSESWYAWWKHPADRARRHADYDRYLTDEVLPLTRMKNGNPFLIATGGSFGGYHALNFAFRHPHLVGRLLSMSGLADIRWFLDGHYGSECYYQNPCDFLAHEHEAWRLDALRRMDIILAVGKTDRLRASNEQLSAVLWSKNIWHALRLWDGLAHDWPVWAHMLHLYLAGHD